MAGDGRPPTFRKARVPSVTLLDGVEAVFFDLFDTLVHVDLERLPLHPVPAPEEIQTLMGPKTRSTLPIVYEEVVAELGVSFERFFEDLRGVWMEVRDELARHEREGRWIEVSALTRFATAVERMELGLGEGAVDSLALRLAQTHTRALVAASFPAAGAGRLLARVRARGRPTALISNWDYAPGVEQMLEHTGLAGALDKLVVSETLGVRKPDSRMFQEALTHFGVRANNALHVGDLTKGDIWGAGRLGLRTVWINRHGGDYDQDEHAPTLTVSRLSDLLDHVH